MEIQHAILEKLTKIEAYLYFDKETNTPGLVERMREYEERLERLEEDNSVKKKVWAVFGMIGGSVVFFVVELIKWLANNHGK